MIIKRTIRKIRLFFDRESILARYKDGENDLKKGQRYASPVSLSQKREIEQFWAPYKKGLLPSVCFNIKWFDIYNRTNVFGFDIRKYIPDSYLYCVVDRFFNNSAAAFCLDDKNLYDLLFFDVKQPRTVCRKEGRLFMDASYELISWQDVVRLCKSARKVIIKPSVGACAGGGISVWDSGEMSVEVLKKALERGDSFVVQEYIRQSDFLSQFCDNCVNTIRMVTLVLEDQVFVTTAAVIMGGKDALTNHLHSGGLCCGILPDGRLRATAFDGSLNQYETHPNGVVFEGCTIPNYEKCVDLVLKLAPRLSRVSKMIAWDLTLDQYDQPVLIESNLRWGGSIQIAAGPIFGEQTHKVLEFVTKGR